MRETYHVSLWKLGTDELPFEEAFALIDAALKNPATALFEALTTDPQFYRHTPAELSHLIMMRALVGDGADRLLPYNPKATVAAYAEPSPAEQDVREAETILESSIIFH